MKEVPFFKIQSTEEDIKAVSDIVRRGSYWAMGPEIQQFESEIAKYIGTKYALTFNSGTSALHAMLLAYDIKAGDEVIIPSFTFIATANAVKMVGATPVFADIDSTSYGLNFDSVYEKITPKTKAIMPIHYAGGICWDTEVLQELTQEKELLFFEDAAQSFGASLKGKKAGTFGDAAMFSMCQDKILALGEGACLVTNNEDIYNKLKLIRSHGRQETGENYFSSTDTFDYVTLGYNWRMPTILAALGLSQLKRIDQTIKLRQEKAHWYHEQIMKFSLTKNIVCPYIGSERYNHVCQKYTIETSKRDDLQRFLKSKGIQTRAYFGLPVHLTKYYKSFGHKEGQLPITESLAKKVLSLPIYPDLTLNEVKYVIESIREFVRCN
jgi:dTDP-4-amino-4,6-dideoxygalactose transaminase